MAAILVDGFDLAALGLVVERVQQTRDAPARTYPLAEVDGRDGAIYLSDMGVVRPRRIVVEGTQKVDNGTALSVLHGFRDELLWRLSGRQVQLELADQPGRYVVARAEPIELTPIPPDFEQRAQRVRITFVCADPLWYAPAMTTVTFTSGATELPLGSAPVRGVITIEGPVISPVVIYRDAAGVERGRMDFGGTEIAADSALVVDCTRWTIESDTGVNAAHALLAGTFLRLDPRDAESLTGDWPTIEVAPTPESATIVYRRGWL